jgi:hypothetical protein
MIHDISPGVSVFRDFVGCAKIGLNLVAKNLDLRTAVWSRDL